MANRYDFDDNEKGKLAGLWESMGPRVTVGAVTLAVVLLAGVIWATYPDGDDAMPGDAVPIVRADAGEFKITPDDPGGMQIAHRDSTVFGAGSNSEAGVENLLADDDSEEPMPKSQLFAGLNTGEPSAEMADSMPPQPDSAQATVPATDPAQSAASSQTASIEEKILNDTAPAAGALSEPVQEATPPKEVDMAQAARAAAQLEPAAGAATGAASATKDAAKEAAKAAAKAAKVEPAAGAASGNFYIQVGSVKEASKADAEWKKIQAKHSQLSTLTHRVERADLGAKGVFYRIQAGPVSKENAAASCDAIKKVTPGGCLIVAD